MLSKYLKFIFLVHCVFGDKSFTLVVDTTRSMKDEINLLKDNLEPILQAMSSGKFENFILLPLIYLDPGPPLIRQSPLGLIDLIDAIEVSEHYGCRKNSLSAIKKALEVSKSRSLIFVFTDAEAQDTNNFHSIQNLCENSQSQVVIFQSGSCVQDSRFVNENIYKNIVNSCRGSYFFFNIADLQESFKFMREIAKVDWTEILSHKEFYGNTEYSLSIDVYTKDVLVAISGSNPQIEIKNYLGKKVRFDEIIATSYSKVVRIPKSTFGEYIADISSNGATLMTVYRRKEFKFSQGFSPMQPKSLRETTLLPIPGIMNYLLISLPDNSLQLVSIQLKMVDENDHRTLNHHTIDGNKKLYAATILIEPEKTFQVLVKCRDGNNKEISSASNKIESQRLGQGPGAIPTLRGNAHTEATNKFCMGKTTFLELFILKNRKTNVVRLDVERLPARGVTDLQRLAPQAEILESDPLIDFGESYYLACKVNSYPKPNIWWENSMHEMMRSESALLEIPHVYISYVNIENITKNETITCNCKNAEGEDSIEAHIYVNRTFTFEVIQSPSDITVEYGSEGRIFCKANTYPEAEIKWYHNDTIIENSENIEILPDGQTLLINKMNIDATGRYDCQISNTIESRTFSAEVYISGLESPLVDLKTSEIILKPGDQMEQECTIIQGTPFPEIIWKYKPANDNNELSGVPDGVTSDGAILKIDSAHLDVGGFYVCEAINILGMDKREVFIKIQYPPKIRNEDEIKTVTSGELVELRCDVDAVPEADVHWDMYKDDVIVPFDGHHTTDYSNTHRFTASNKDSGSYVCLAQNNVGSAIRTVTLTVYVAPYIEPLAWKALRAGRGSTIILGCNVTSGIPVPSSRWIFIDPSFDTTELMRSTSGGNLDLVLKNITQKQEGSYQCIAENQLASDSIKISLKVA